MAMNAGIISLMDGSPCIVYDEKLPHEISHVEFNEDNHLITLAYENPAPGSKRGYQFSYPLDRPFLAVIRERGSVVVAYMKDKQLVDINICIVRFTIV